MCIRDSGYTDTGLGEAELVGNVDGAHHSLLIVEKQDRLQIVFSRFVNFHGLTTFRRDFYHYTINRRAIARGTLVAKLHEKILKKSLTKLTYRGIVIE